MKKVALHLFVLALVLAAQQAWAAHGTLAVQSFTGRYTVVINNATYPSNFGTFTIPGMMPGAYRVQVIPEPTRRNTPFTPVFSYDAWVHLKPYETFTISFERNGLVRTVSTVHAPAHVVIAPAPVCHDVHYGSFHQPVQHGMPHDQFAALKHLVISRSFDSSKRDLLRMGLANNRVTSQQLYELVSLLDFESSRVEIAKAGYASVVDKHNFFTVYNAFSFSSSIRELNRFIE